MDFSLTREQALVKKMMQAFTENEVKPIAAEIDRTHQYPAENVAKLFKLGVMGMTVPKEYGGMGADQVAAAICTEELAKACASTSDIVAGHTLCCVPILEHGNEEQKKKYLPMLTKGGVLGGMGITEPNAGSDASKSQTEAKQEGDHYVTNGPKIFITTGPDAGVFVIFAMTDKTKGNKGLSAFVVDMHAPGVSCGKPENKMGVVGCATSDIILENVVVPESDRLGEEGDGFKIAMQTLNTGRLGVSAQSIGVAQGCLDEAIKYAKERKQFGRRIADFQAISFMIADMATKLEAAKQLVYKAAYMMDTKQDATLNASMAKYYASEVCNEIAQKAVQIHGGYGFIKDYKIERMFRDCRVFTIYEGTSQVQQMVIGGKLLKK